ncbi:hypothetical protein VN0532_06830 [Helicobacter pylori]
MKESQIINFLKLSDYDIKERSFISLPLYKINQNPDSYYTEIHDFFRQRQRIRCFRKSC